MMEMLTTTFWDNVYNVFRDIVPVILAGGGIYVVYRQLRQILRQNELMEKSVKQTYRPLGVFYGIEEAINNELTDNVFTFMYDANHKLHVLNIYLKCTVNNGVLKLKGFSMSQMECKIESVKQHLLKVDMFTRQDVQLTNGQYHRWDNIQFGATVAAYLYIIALYEDQDDNLYGTVLELKLMNADYAIRVDGEQVPSRPAVQVMGKNQYYFSFDSKEKKALEQKMKWVSDATTPSVR